MKKLLVIAFSLFIQTSYSQDLLQVPKAKHWFDFKDKFYQWRIYAYWGYNRSYYTRSDIHFHGNGYDITVYNAVAKDRPLKFSFKTYFDPVSSTIPQYNVRLGFYVKHNFHISIGLDHMKYVMVQNQTAVVSGFINPSVSTAYSGVYSNKEQTLTRNFLRFEHTNGLNLISLDAEYLLPIYHLKDWLHVGWNFGMGGFFVITKTDVKIVGIGTDNRFHLSGYCIPFKSGPRIDLWRYFFLAFEVKGGYMHLPNVTVNNNNTDLANHNFSFVEYYGVVGLSVGLSRGANAPLHKKKNSRNSFAKVNYV